MTVLVTGRTGTLGRALVPLLDDPRVLSRRAGPGRVVGDLRTGAGLDDAVAGASVIVHCATAPRGDSAATGRLVEAARRAGTPHLVYISIVGIDRIPLPYYREKVNAERLVSGSGLPWTILRATQFHDLLATLFATTARAGVLPVLAGTAFQPIAVDDVAARLAALAAGPPQGWTPPMGGPEVRPMGDLARTWAGTTGRRRPVVPLRLPGAIARGYRSGAHVAPGHADGVVTFEQFLASRAAVRS
ncbi:nucleotide-diphosphate-sugar epimerase [Actinomycetospora sp. NBRC 106375]|uniref:SDR family oxidoreductase n=1 Tax=Actinomycetospora sp. NBRC 106375 TaxID=3032207 RepID=UPI0024A1057D|nr:NAD(P)H-binding protein [Actinomycetospora sp. NBRC 106375]GLZ49375.1 nucleotide-diphosphate-sugar epimerase [Actinomycetospora sp. NBRC 106375]